MREILFRGKRIANDEWVSVIPTYPFVIGNALATK